MGCSPNGVDRINSFALVTYLPGALGQFLDQLRKDLVSSCVARSHVTLLPPRTLIATPEDVQRQIELTLGDFTPFDVELGQIEVFPVTNVVYIELSKGRKELERIHAALNRSTLFYDEPYEFHPHVTLAQGLAVQHVDEALADARHQWKEFAYSRKFPLDQATFVQNTSANNWIDLMYYSLPQPALPGSRR